MNGKIVQFDSNDNYKELYYDHGGSPKLLTSLITYLQSNKKDISSISISLYLFNNKILHDFFLSLSKDGIDIDIFTIPIEGYDTSLPQKITNLKDAKTSHRGFTKYNLARDIFAQFYRQTTPKNYNLFFTPHMFVRSSKLTKFSRGNQPYSLHIKFGLIKFKNPNTSGTVLLTSSNFAVRDLPKEENMIIIENNVNMYNQSQTFFNDLSEASINIVNFDFEKNYSDYLIKPKKENLSNEIGFNAPFYPKSSEKIESIISTLVKSAENRIVIVAQHICAIDYFVNNKYSSYSQESKRKGFLTDVIIKANSGAIDVEILSQVFHEESFKGHKMNVPKNEKQFKYFFDKISKIKNINYYVNDKIHNKYIIVDNKVLITTFNYTPTQFIYLDKVKIDEFDYIPNVKYDGIHSEIGAFVLIDDAEIASKYYENFKGIISKSRTIKVH